MFIIIVASPSITSMLQAGRQAGSCYHHQQQQQQQQLVIQLDAHAHFFVLDIIRTCTCFMFLLLGLFTFLPFLLFLLLGLGGLDFVPPLIPSRPHAPCEARCRQPEQLRQR
jgi:hypothetical protein